MLIDAHLIVLIGAAAALLQLGGYVVYVRSSDIEPNPVTWLMFAYGTMLLTALEWDSEASAAELFLPITCSIMAVYVAGRCWLRAWRRSPGRLWPCEWWPDDWRDRLAFQLDLTLTAMYLAAAVLANDHRIPAEAKDAAVLVFLVAANLTTVSAFFPLMRNVIESPDTERTLPWAIWTVAYALLGIATYATQGTVWTELMLYPVLNAVLHGLVAFFSRESRRQVWTHQQAWRI